MSKIKDLLANREKLARYDELTEWKKKFEDISVLFERGYVELRAINLPASIKSIIVSALEAEIKKLDEE